MPDERPHNSFGGSASLAGGGSFLFPIGFPEGRVGNE
jgi:hypothetical protein